MNGGSMKVSARQEKAISKYVRWIADAMELRDWTLRVVLNVEENDLREVDDHDGGNDVWGAACDPVRGRKYASIHLGREMIGRLLDGNREEFRQTVVHELTHCHFAQLWDLLRLDLYDARQITQDSYDIFIKNAERNMEYGIDAVADAIAKHMPLIDFPER